MEKKKLLSRAILVICITVLSIITLTYSYKADSDIPPYNAQLTDSRPCTTFNTQSNYLYNMPLKYDILGFKRCSQTSLKRKSRHTHRIRSGSIYYLSSLNFGSSIDGGHLDASIGLDGSIIIELPGADEITAGDTSVAISLILQKYKGIGVVIIGVCVITAILCLLFQIMKLGAAGDNECKRVSAMKGIVICGAVIAVFGALSLVVGIFWNVLV